jgi:hypothetical protein
MPLLVLALAVLLAGCGSSRQDRRAPTATPTPAVTPGPRALDAAVPARQFTDSVCVNTHLHYLDTAYARFPELRDALLEAGIEHVRDSQLHDGAPSYSTIAARWQELASLGMGVTAGVNPADALEEANANPAVEATEGPNEPDLAGPGWQQRLLDAQRALWEGTRAQPNLASKPVLAGALGHSEHWSEFTGDLAPYFTYGNIHAYPGGLPPGDNLGEELAAVAKPFAGRPVVATETGYHTATDAPRTEGHLPASERAHGIYVAQMYLEYFRRGIARTCIYELVDLKPNPEHDSREENFGLLRNDLTPKPAFRSVARMQALLADPLPATSPEPLDYTLTGPPTLRRLLMQKGDGSWWLAVWNDESVWDPVERTDLSPPDASATLSFDEPHAVRIHDIASGRTTSRSPTAGPVALSVPVSPLLIRISAAG